jgi:hypothetical protein
LVPGTTRITVTATCTGGFPAAKGPVQGIKGIACGEKDDEEGEDVLHGKDRMLRVES